MENVKFVQRMAVNIRRGKKKRKTSKKSKEWNVYISV